MNQIPLIKAAQRCGFQVIGVDQNSSAPGFYYCDLKIQESINDYKNIYIKLRELLVDGKISAVMTKSYGDAVKTVSYLCEKLNLEHIPFEESGKFIDKKIMLTNYSKWGINTPPRQKISLTGKGTSPSQKAFPIIVKPKTGHAKTDVKLIENKEELLSFLKDKNKRDFIFEKMIPGDEIITAGIVLNGTFYNILITDKETTPPPYFVDIVHTAPSKHSQFENEINKIGQKIADAFKIKNSPIIMEFIVSQGQLYLLEAVPEFGGEFIPEFVVPHSTGYNIIENSVRAFSGQKFKSPEKILQRHPVVVKYITAQSGTLRSFSMDRAGMPKELLHVKIFKDVGSHIDRLQSNHDRIGVIICKGKTVTRAREACHEVEEKLKIRIDHEK